MNSKRAKSRSEVTACALRLGIVGLLASPGLAALEYNYALYSSAEYTDNIRQGAEDDVAGSILRGGVAFGANTPRNTTFAADVAGDLSALYYTEGGLDTENRYRLDGSFLVQPSSNNFRLAVINSLHQVRENRRVVRDVNNTRDVNIFSVIPSYHVDLTRRSRVRASYQYANIQDELDLSSREVNSVTVGYEYSVSNLSDLSLNVSQSDIEFTDVGQEIEQQSAYLRWAYDGNLTNWMLDLGQQQVVEVNDSGIALVNFSVDRVVNNNSTLGLFYQQGYSDVVDSSVSARLTGLVPNSDAVFADELAREKELSLAYGYNRGNLDASLRLEARQLESEEAVSIGRNVDEDRYTLRMAADYRFPTQEHNLSAWGIGGGYRYMDERFNFENEEQEINEATLRLNYYATRTTRMYFELRSRDTAGNAPQADTDENSFLVGIRFSPRGGL